MVPKKSGKWWRSKIALEKLLHCFCDCGRKSKGVKALNLFLIRIRIISRKMLILMQGGVQSSLPSSKSQSSYLFSILANHRHLSKINHQASKQPHHHSTHLHHLPHLATQVCLQAFNDQGGGGEKERRNPRVNFGKSAPY